jgi:hypothetical protein
VTRTQHLSLTALRMAASGGAHDSSLVAHRLYRYGTVPRGPAIERDFGPDDDPMAVLGMTIGGRTRRLLEAAYDPTALPGWYSFARTGRPAPISAACKLYVSPRPEALADAFPRIVHEIVECDVRSFKVGRGIEGLLRPDKIILYFDDRAHLEETGRLLERSLCGCPVQGVPFSAQLGVSGLLSSGVDPPLAHGATSWRAWITTRLAASLTELRALPRDAAVASALSRIRRAGVDEAWVPSADAFRDEVPS